MSAINLNGSCIGILLSRQIDENKIIEGISKSLGLKSGIDVIATLSTLNSPKIFDNALLFVDIHYKPEGMAVNCLICSVNLDKLIPSGETFLKNLSLLLNDNIFIDISFNMGLIFKPNGEMEEKKFESYFVGDIECVQIIN